MSFKLMGVDFGTGGCKATIIDTTGKVLGSASKEYITYYPHSGWSEQNTEDWITAFIDTVKACLQKSGIDSKELAGLALTASTHNAVLVDKEGKVIRPCIMWTDQRSVKQTQWLREHYGQQIFAIGMQQVSPTWTLPQLLWIKENEPENYRRINKIYFTKDYIRSFLTGDWCTDHVDAQGSLLYDAKKREWSAELCKIIDLPVEALPPVVKSKAIAGTVQRRASELTGLPEGLPVVAGCSDTAAEDYGSGAVNPGQMIIKMATAGNVNLITKEAVPNDKSFTYPYVIEDLWYTVLATNSCASSYRWLRDSIFSLEKDVCNNVYELMDELASQVPIGSQGLIYHPYLLGERCPYYNAHLRASFIGLNMIHEKKHFARAVMEGVAFSLNDCFQIVNNMNVEIKEIRLIGGGAKSTLWSQIVSDVIGLPLLRPENDDSSFGGALLAGVGVGIFGGEVEAVLSCVRIEKELQPNMENHKKYQQFFEVYQDIVNKLTPTYSKLYNIVNP